MVTATMTERISNLVVPLALEVTAMRTTETTGLVAHDRSGAVSMLIGASLRRGDVDSTNGNSTPLTLTMPGFRTSTTATRTTTTRTTTTERVPSADGFERHHDDFSFEELVQAYLDCRESKRNSASALAFEQNLERNLCKLHDELTGGTYRPGRSICFVITRPKPREVWAADFRDRIVHHLLYNRVAPRFYASFIADSVEGAAGEVTRANMDKLHLCHCEDADFTPCKKCHDTGRYAIKDENGKVKKPSGWVAPNIEPFACKEKDSAHG